MLNKGNIYPLGFIVVTVISCSTEVMDVELAVFDVVPMFNLYAIITELQDAVICRP